jgi:Cu+-exporting ATPase
MSNESVSNTAASATMKGGSMTDGVRALAICRHCGLDCRDAVFRREDKSFCCQGCLTVFELLTAHGLVDFYRLGQRAGMQFQRPVATEQFGYLDEPVLRSRLVQFDSEKLTRITFRVPAIHCVACVWLLENLPRLDPAINEARVNFPRQEVSFAFDPRRIKLSEAVALLASLGYPPDLRFDDLDRVPTNPVSRRLWLQVGLAGFAFGNIMLFSLPTYFGLDSFSGPMFSQVFGWFSFALALPVFGYSAADYWRSAWTGLRQRQLTIEVPIVLGLIAIMARSLYEVGTGVGEGYFDSLTG